MVVYSHRTVPLNVAAGLRQFAGRLAGLPAAPGHDALIALLVDWGEAESAVADALLPQWDDELEALEAWRAVSDAMAAASCASWEEDAADRDLALILARAALGRLLALPAPRIVPSKTAEGFGYYGLYPEQYMAAARRFALQSPARVLCVGLRSAGSILGHVVAATLRRHGVDAVARSVRPRGAPFDRRLHVSARLRAALRAVEPSHVAVVDEGPGLSGSSLASAADFFAADGFPAERIVLFPSWDAPAANLRSGRAREVWRTHAKVIETFEAVNLRRGRLFGTMTIAADLSAGAWRSRCYPAGAGWPAVHPQHEGRKYLAGDGTAVLRFAGLGRRGPALRERAMALAAAGFGGGATRLIRGFLEQRWIPGRPLTAADATPPVVRRLAAYLAFLQRRFPTGVADPTDDLAAMASANAVEGLGAWAGGVIERLARGVRGIAAPAVAVDGRMLPHEWIASSGRLIKVDALDHHDDDFWPGCRDVAWDVAGTIVEFGLTPAMAAYFVDEYRRAAADHSIGLRLPLYEAGYLAYRLGYASLAADTLGSSPDGRAFSRLCHQYRRSLAERLVRSHRGSPR